MKKMTKIVALLLVVLMIAALAACGQKAPTVVGKWSYSMDLKKMMDASLSASGANLDESQKQMMEQMYSAFEGCELLMLLEFSEDGNYKASVDKDSATAAFDKAKEALAKTIPALYAQMLNMTEEQFDEYLKQQNTTKEQLAKSFVDTMNIDDIADNVTEGKYRLDGDKLYMSSDDSDDSETDSTSATEPEHYVTISLTADELSITDVSGTTDESDSALIKKELLPMVFKRIG